MSYKLSDVLNRNLGTVTKIWKLDGGYGGRFKPGPDFDKIAPLYEAYNDFAGGVGDSEWQDIYQDLVSLEPRLISAADQSERKFHCVIVSEVPRGYMVTLVEDPTSPVTAADT